MKQRRLLFAAMLIASPLWFGAQAASADNHAKDRAAIRSAVHQMDAAIANKDVSAYIAFTAPDFVNVDINGTETTHGKEERRDNIARNLSRINHVREHTTVTKIAFIEGGAIVTETSDASVRLIVNGQSTVMRNHTTYRDFWVKTSKGWLEKRSRTISSQTTRNGTPVP